MPTSSEHIIFGVSDDEIRLDGKAVRRILHRAVVEQHRRDVELTDTYSLGELEEMAAEAGISRDALQAAIDERPSWLDPLLQWLPRDWSPATRRIVLMGGAGIALLGVMLAFPIVAKVLFWATIIVLVMMALGVSPF